MSNNDWVVEAIRLFGFEYTNELFWRDDYPNKGDFYLSVVCSDVFAWGTADTEQILEEDVVPLRVLLEQQRILQKTQYPDDWYLPWLCRKRGQRPQGAMYKYIHEGIAELINSEFPERDIDILNPKTTEGEYKYGRKT